MTQDFFGGKGGGGSFSQRPDTLRSIDVFEGILGMAAGPLKGLTKGLKSQKLNGTYVEDASGVLNFKDMAISITNGDPALFPQPIIPALGTGGVPTSVNISLTNTDVTGTVPGDWVTQTMGNLNADFIDLRFIVDQLYIQDKSGIKELSANLEIQMKPTGLTTWINPSLTAATGTYNSSDGSLDGTPSGTKLFLPRSYFNGAGALNAESNSGYLKITGKTLSPYVKELRIRVPNEGPYLNKTWDVRVRLREPANIDADPNFTKRIIRWESISGGYSDPLGTTEGWRGLATMRIYGKATDEFNGVPILEGIWDCKLVSVPPIGVYNPNTRQYTGAFWDGSFSKAYTNDPAWVINDVLSDALVGMSSLAPGSYLNKWDALEASKWCSTLVSDGDVGTHPRYSLNFRSQAPQKANEFVQYLAGAIGGFAWDNGNGEWRLKLDKPEAPSDIVTLETIDGEFAYSHTDISTRYNDITVTFLNEALDFREDRVSVVDNAAIALYGRKPTTIVAVGCTNRQEAVRRATLRLRASLNETKMVTYTTNRRGKLLTPFATVLIADGDLGYQLPAGSTLSNDYTPYNNRTTGRLVEISDDRTNITLRDSVRLELGVTYVLHFAIPNPNYNPTATTEPTDGTWDQPTLTVTRTIINSGLQRGDVNTLYLGSAMPADLPEFLAVAIEAAGLPSIPKMYRILGINVDEQNPEKNTLSCIEVDVGKWAAADTATASSASYQAPPIVAPPPLPPSAGAFLSTFRIPGDSPDILNLVVNWQRPSSLFLSGFRVRYRLNNGPWVVAVDGLQDTSFELVNPAEGSYYVEVCSRDRRGSYSAPLAGTIAIGTVIDDAYVAGASLGVEMICDKTVAADHLGVISSDNLSALVWAPTVVKGGVTVKQLATTTYSLINLYGVTSGVGTGFTADSTTGSSLKGNVSLLPGTTLADTSGGDLLVTIEGVAQPKVPFRLFKARSAPPAGGAAGGYGKNQTWTAGQFVSTSIVTYARIVTTHKTVTLGPGESLYLTAVLDYNVGGMGGATRTLTVKGRYAAAGSNAWNDFAVGVVGTPAYAASNTGSPDFEYYDPMPGTVSCIQTKSGLPAGDYDVDVVGHSSGTTRIVTPGITAYLEAKV